MQSEARNCSLALLCGQRYGSSRRSLVNVSRHDASSGAFSLIGLGLMGTLCSLLGPGDDEWTDGALEGAGRNVPYCPVAFLGTGARSPDDSPVASDATCSPLPWTPLGSPTAVASDDSRSEVTTYVVTGFQRTGTRTMRTKSRKADKEM